MAARATPDAGAVSGGGASSASATGSNVRAETMERYVDQPHDTVAVTAGRRAGGMSEKQRISGSMTSDTTAVESESYFYWK